MINTLKASGSVKRQGPNWTLLGPFVVVFLFFFFFFFFFLSFVFSGTGSVQLLQGKKLARMVLVIHSSAVALCESLTNVVATSSPKITPHQFFAAKKTRPDRGQNSVRFGASPLNETRNAGAQTKHTAREFQPKSQSCISLPQLEAVMIANTRERACNARGFGYQRERRAKKR